MVIRRRDRGLGPYPGRSGRRDQAPPAGILPAQLELADLTGSASDARYEDRLAELRRMPTARAATSGSSSPLRRSGG